MTTRMIIVITMLACMYPPNVKHPLANILPFADLLITTFTCATSEEEWDTQASASRRPRLKRNVPLSVARLANAAQPLSHDTDELSDGESALESDAACLDDFVSKHGDDAGGGDDADSRDLGSEGVDGEQDNQEDNEGDEENDSDEGDEDDAADACDEERESEGEPSENEDEDDVADGCEEDGVADVGINYDSDDDALVDDVYAAEGFAPL